MIRSSRPRPFEPLPSVCLALLLLAMLGAGALNGCASGNGTAAVNQNASDASNDANRNSGGNSATPTDPSKGLTWAQVREWWIGKNRDPRYAEDDFLCGVGSSPYRGDTSLPQAEVQARSSLLAFFQTKIEAEMKEYASQIITARDNAPASVRESLSSTSSVRAVVSGVAEGAKLVQMAIAPDKTVAYALVVLDRKIFADNLKVEIDALKKQVKGYYDAAQRARGRSAHFSAIGSYTMTLPLLDRLVILIKQYNLGKPPYYPSMSLDIDVGDVLGGLLDSAEHMTFAFRLDVTWKLRDGKTVSGKSVEAESAIIDAFNDSHVAATVIRATPRFTAAKPDAIKTMTAEAVRELLDGNEVNYVIVGTLESYHIGADNNPADNKTYQKYRCRYDTQVIELKTGRTWPVASAEGPIGFNYNDEVAAGQAARNAARAIAEKMRDRFSAEN
ncbi:MAG: hypothetical protein AB7K09_03740 [Planctomycetota bacterium]